MKDFRLGLVIHACFLPKELDRLVSSLFQLTPLPGLHVHLATVTERKEARLPGDGAFVTEYQLPYPDADRVKFNPAKAKNIAIRTLLPLCDAIACLDADYIVPPGLLELCTYPVFGDRHLFVRRRDITEADATPRKWAEWLKLPVFGAKDGNECRGSFNCLSVENWKKIGGYDERGFGFGGDDDALHYRMFKAGIEKVTVDSLPLVHIGHSLREWSGVNARGEANWKVCTETAQPDFLT